MNRRHFLSSTAATGAVAAIPAVLQAQPSPVAPLFDQLVQEGFEQRPEGATQLGLDTGRNAALRARLTDESDAGRGAAKALTQDQLRRLETVDRAALSPADRRTLDVVLYTRRSAAEVQAFDFGGSNYGPSPYVISQLTGAYQSVPDFMDTKHPVETAADAEAYLQRLHAFAGQLDAQTGRLRHDVAAGVVPPDFLLDKTIAQLAKIAVPAREAKLVQSLDRRARAKGLAGYGDKAAAIYTAQVLPALARQLAAVRDVRTRATHDAGVWKVPRGDAFYQVALSNTTTTRLTPEQVHRFGLDQAAAISARMDAAMRCAGMTTGTIGARLAAINTLPGQVYANTDAGKAQAIAYCNERLTAIRARLPQAFHRVPTYSFEVRRVPPETEAGAASAFSQSPSLDGKRPGLVYFNLQDSAEWPKFMLPTVVYHEGLPGHQFEGGLALSNKNLPLIRKLTGFSGYGEGWALYAEQLADELGMYANDPLGQIGYLKEQLFRAHRCIVDTGLHHYRWSKERAVALFVDQQGETPGFATREVDRYCAQPGQACSYKLGHSTFVAIRDKAKAKLGARFDLKAYHDVVLGAGRVPLDMLQQIGDDWIATV